MRCDELGDIRTSTCGTILKASFCMLAIETIKWLSWWVHTKYYFNIHSLLDGNVFNCVWLSVSLFTGSQGSHHTFIGKRAVGLQMKGFLLLNKTRKKVHDKIVLFYCREYAERSDDSARPLGFKKFVVRYSNPPQPLCVAVQNTKGRGIEVMVDPFS